MKILYTFTLLCLCLLSSCSSDDDIDFDTVGSTFEIIIDSFSTANNFSEVVTVPNTIEVLNSDVALVYVLDPIKSANFNNDVWEPLPRTFFFEDGGFAQFQFNFIFNEASTTADIEVFLESDNLLNLDPNLTQDQNFRIVIVPARFAQDPTIDLTDINAVQAALKNGL